ncbi:MAG TPA: anthrone oxygenase family protein [Anseongella sp.]
MQILLLITSVLVALAAGLFYSYSISVIPGLGRLADREYLHSMQSINRAILNPLFFASFLGSLFALPASAWLWYHTRGADNGFYLLLGATLLYCIGVFMVTVVANVPLNNTLDKLDINAVQNDRLREHRTAFETPWNRYHTIRTVSNAAALVCLLWAVIPLIT